MLHNSGLITIVIGFNDEMDMHEDDMILIEFSPSLPATVRAAILRLNVRGVTAIINYDRG